MSTKPVHVQLPLDNASSRLGTSPLSAPMTSSSNASPPVSDSRPKIDRTKPSKKSLVSSFFKSLSFHRAAGRSSSLHDRVTVPPSKESKKSAQPKTPTQSRPGHPVMGAQMNIIA